MACIHEEDPVLGTRLYITRSCRLVPDDNMKSVAHSAGSDGVWDHIISLPLYFMTAGNQFYYVNMYRY